MLIRVGLVQQNRSISESTLKRDNCHVRSLIISPVDSQKVCFVAIKLQTGFTNFLRVVLKKNALKHS